jgi:DNA-binding HxlR family transcriptional regulator
MLGGATGFNEIQRCLPGVSRSVLAGRLKDLERAGVIERRIGADGRATGYRLTPRGRDLKPVLFAIGSWGATWLLDDPEPEEIDPDFIMVWMARDVDRDALPAGRTVIQFDFPDCRKRYWMVLEPTEASMCPKPPGFDVDLWVTVDASTLYDLFLGKLELRSALRDETLAMTGPSDLRSGFARWFTWSAFRPATLTAEDRRSAALQLKDRARVLIGT